MTTWTLADVGGGTCVAVNRRGQVLGRDSSGASFILSADGTRTDLGPLADGTTATGVAMNDGGEVVGFGEGPQGRTAIHYAGGAWHAVGDLADARWSSAYAISADGQIVGARGLDMPGQMRAFLVAGDTHVDLPLGASLDSIANAAGGAGRIAGVLETETGATHAFVADGDALRDLGTLGGGASNALGMNGRGDVVGVAQTAEHARHAFVALQGASMVDLGVPAGAVATEARGIDDQGRIAGTLFGADGLGRPAILVAGGDPVLLVPEPSPYVAAFVTAMAGDGRIVGWGVPSEPDQNPIHCLVWTPGSAR